MGLPNFEAVFKKKKQLKCVTSQLFLKTVSKFDDPTQWDRPQNIPLRKPHIIWGIFGGRFHCGGSSNFEIVLKTKKAEM